MDGEGRDAGVVYCEMQSRENSMEDLTSRELLRAFYPGACGYKVDAHCGGRGRCRCRGAAFVLRVSLLLLVLSTSSLLAVAHRGQSETGGLLHNLRTTCTHAKVGFRCHHILSHRCCALSSCSCCSFLSPISLSLSLRHACRCTPACSCPVGCAVPRGLLPGREPVCDGGRRRAARSPLRRPAARR